jgi:hypothetical protein
LLQRIGRAVNFATTKGTALLLEVSALSYRTLIRPTLDIFPSTPIATSTSPLPLSDRFSPIKTWSIPARSLEESPAEILRTDISCPPIVTVTAASLDRPRNPVA